MVEKTYISVHHHNRICTGFTDASARLECTACFSYQIDADLTSAKARVAEDSPQPGILRIEGGFEFFQMNLGEPS